ncbi:LacI family DNA-binding transcriptional regulator [Truepera radiovictrix]|uniref:Transcriptional regulator, LacI family n=1 Tax=Truepera radiovictrix (strain DSM 17093 / CIP 108686 / LMG 22925 / RQ-24) TaxID=649638 RepID=D7CQW0_TRURR|nr:LacI family DNA-binding transcriptional regulator [Truepera radiovictrix]ADI15094.1 transcriptional regulator, LacI family [Truepera radiovictrix DSM 17093]WMT56353.1 LacI family DNA-binding transcriptional regulator [Truepera radiovictrix]
MAKQPPPTKRPAKRPTSFEVAELAGVSRSTVSLVLNGVPKANISQATQQRVLEAARALGYVPSAAGRTLASGRTRTLGLLICHAEHLRVDAFIPQALFGLNQVSQRYGFKVIVEAVEEPRPGAYLELVRAKQVDGLVVLNPRRGDAQLSELAREGFPLVIMGASEIPEVCTVSSRDNTLGARRAVTHLIALGHTRIAHISYGGLEYRGAEERFEGYRRALEAAGLPFEGALVREGDYSAESGFSAMASLLEAGAGFTALFASNDTVALGAMAALRERGLRIPEDVAVVGYDDIPLAAFAAPPLTTVRSPALEHGRLAGEMLVSLIRGERPERTQVDFELELVVRASCGAASPPRR